MKQITFVFISIANIETLADFHFAVKQYVRGVLFRLCGEDDNIFQTKNKTTHKN